MSDGIPGDSIEKQACSGSTEAHCSMPWDRKELVGWAIVGMNHYHTAGKRHLFCAMVKDGRCITAEGECEEVVFDMLAKKA